MILRKAPLAAPPHASPIKFGSPAMTFQDIYLYGVVFAFAAFMLTLFVVSTAGWLKK